MTTQNEELIEKDIIKKQEKRQKKKKPKMKVSGAKAKKLQRIISEKN